MSPAEVLTLAVGAALVHQRYRVAMVVVQHSADGIWLAPVGAPDGPRCPLTAPEEWRLPAETEAPLCG